MESIEMNPQIQHAESQTRITIVEQIYFQQMANPSGPRGWDSRFCHCSNNNEQPYERSMVVSEEWLEIKTMWVEDACLFYIRNDQGSFRQKQPTPKERVDELSKVIEVCINHKVSSSLGIPLIPMILIEPQHSTRLQPAKDCTIYLRCQKGQAKFSIVVFPR